MSLNYRGKTSHKSFMGGIVTVVGGLIIGAYISYKIYVWLQQESDSIKSFSEFNDYANIGAIQLEGSDMNFVIYLQDPDFDNSDNPYGLIMLHRHTNMNDDDKEVVDDVPLKECTDYKD